MNGLREGGASRFCFRRAARFPILADTLVDEEASMTTRAALRLFLLSVSFPAIFDGAFGAEQKTGFLPVKTPICNLSCC